MNPATIRTGLKNRLANITGLQAYDTVPAKPEVPCAIVEPADPFVAVHSTMGKGFCDTHFKVRVLVQWTDWPTVQASLDAYIATGTGETTSIIDTLEATTTTVAGGAQQVVVSDVGGYGKVEIDQVGYGSVEFTVYVPASRA